MLQHFLPENNPLVIQLNTNMKRKINSMDTACTTYIYIIFFHLCLFFLIILKALMQQSFTVTETRWAGSLLGIQNDSIVLLQD